MVAKMRDMGVQVFMQSALVDVTPGAEPAVGEDRARASPTTLHFAKGTVRATGAVMLNLPRNRLLMLPSIARLVPARTLGMLKCVAFDTPASMFGNKSMTTSTSLAKAYFYYEDAWWHTKINQTIGEWPANPFDPIIISQGIGIGIHWNDGPVACTDSLGYGTPRPLRPKCLCMGIG